MEASQIRGQTEAEAVVLSGDGSLRSGTTRGACPEPPQATAHTSGPQEGLSSWDGTFATLHIAQVCVSPDFHLVLVETSIPKLERVLKLRQVGDQKEFT